MLKKLFGLEKRQQYRVTPSADEIFTADLLIDNEVLSATLEDLSLGGASITFSNKSCPSLRVGDVVYLKIKLQDRPEALLPEVIIRHISYDQDRTTFHLQFTSPDELTTRLTPQELSYFNRRQSFRVTPIEVEHIPIVIRWASESVEGWMIDLSLTGMGFGLANEVADELGKPARIRLSFILPAKEEELRITGNVQFRRQRQEHYLYGIKFDFDDFAEGRRQEAAISAFLMKQQQILLQKRSHLKHGD